VRSWELPSQGCGAGVVAIGTIVRMTGSSLGGVGFLSCFLPQ